MRSWTIKLHYFLLLLLIFGSTVGLSQEKGFVIGPASVNELQMRSGSMSYLEERSNKSLEPQNLIKRKLRLLKTSVPNFGLIPYDVSFRRNIDNRTDQEQEFYLILSNVNLDKADFHIFRSETATLRETRL